MLGAYQFDRNGLRSAINVSKCGHNVTGALLGCRFRDADVGGSNLFAVARLKSIIYGSVVTYAKDVSSI